MQICHFKMSDACHMMCVCVCACVSNWLYLESQARKQQRVVCSEMACRENISKPYVACLPRGSAWPGIYILFSMYSEAQYQVQKYTPSFKHATVGTGMSYTSAEAQTRSKQTPEVTDGMTTQSEWRRKAIVLWFPMLPTLSLDLR